MNNLRIPSSTAESLLGQQGGYAAPIGAVPGSIQPAPGIPGRGVVTPPRQVPKSGFKSL